MVHSLRLLALTLALAPLALAARPAAQVGQETISRAELEARVARHITTTRYHRRPDPETVAKMRVELLDDMVAERLLVLEARRRGLDVDRKAVQERLEEHTAQYGGPEKFQGVLGRAWPEYVQAVEHEVLIDALVEAVAAETAGAPTLEEARAYYARHKEDYVMPASYKLRAALIQVDPGRVTEPGYWESVRAHAAKFAERRRAGETWEVLEPDYPRAHYQDLGWVHGGSMVADLEAAASELEKGGISDPEKTTTGFFVAELQDKRAARQLEFELVKDAVLARLREHRRERLRDELLVLARQRHPVRTFLEQAAAP